uniref:Uncharacterized protein n=1 Tax=Panagrolaimus sp. JU765 TaxID=591449 RepID=A0AC34RIH5_9BILA
MFQKAFFVWIFLGLATAIELPPELRPAKEIGEPEKPIIPGVHEPQSEIPANVRTPPNLSLRSRMIAALNSPIEEKQESERRRHPTADDVAAAAAKAPLVFQKGPKKQTTKAYAKPLPRVTQTPPAGKNYGVNTIVQTNLVDSQGRVMKGVNSVPIRVAPVPATPRPRATASQVEAVDDQVWTNFRVDNTADIKNHEQRGNESVRLINN